MQGLDGYPAGRRHEAHAAHHTARKGDGEIEHLHLRWDCLIACERVLRAEGRADQQSDWG